MKLCAVLLLVGLATTAGHSPPVPFSSRAANERLTRSLKVADSLLGQSLIKSSRHQPMRDAADILLGDLYLPINDDTTIEFTELRVEMDSILQLISAVPDLSYLNLDLLLNVGNVSVKGDFSVTSRSLLRFLPVTTSGQIRMSLLEVQAAGKVGLQLGSSSLHTQNHDIVYTSKAVHVTVTYESNEGSVVSQVPEDSLEHTLELQLTRELKYRLSVIIQKDLDGMLDIIPVGRLLQEDESLVAEYRNHAKMITASANTYVDTVIEKARDQLISSNMEELAIPEIYASFSKKILWVTWHGSFTANQGFVRNLASIKRTSDISLSYDKGTLVVFGAVGLGELEVGYNHYRAEFMNIGPSGTAKLSVGRNSVFLKATVVLGSAPSATLNEVNVEYIEDIEVKVTGLGILSWLFSKIATWVIGFMNSTIVDIVNNVLHEYIAKILNGVDPNQFFY